MRLLRQIKGVTQRDGERSDEHRIDLGMENKSEVSHVTGCDGMQHSADLFFIYLLNIFKQGRTYRQNHCFTMLPCTI